MNAVASRGTADHGADALTESRYHFSAPDGSELIFMFCQDSKKLVEIVTALLRALCEGDVERLEIDIDPGERRRLWLPISATGSLSVLLARGVSKARPGDTSCVLDSANRPDPR